MKKETPCAFAAHGGDTKDLRNSVLLVETEDDLGDGMQAVVQIRPIGVEIRLTVVESPDVKNTTEKTGRIGDLLHCNPESYPTELTLEGQLDRGSVARFAERVAKFLDSFPDLFNRGTLGKSEFAHLDASELDYLFTPLLPPRSCHDIGSIARGE